MTRPSLPLRIGVLGAANIARDFIKGIAGSKAIRVTEYDFLADPATN